MPQTHMTLAEDFLELAYVLDANLTTKMVLDNFTSFVWTERFYECGEFSMTIPVVEKIVQELRINDYLSIRESEHLMVVETMTLLTDEEKGDTLEIKGRSVESILERRVVWGELKEKLGFELAIKKLLETQVIDPADPRRKIPGIVFKESEIDGIDEDEIDINLLGNNVYDVVTEWCSAHLVGFKMVLTGEHVMSFSLVRGINRTRSQQDRPPVVFSHSFENLLSSNYIQSEVGYASNMLAPGSVGNTYLEVVRLAERTGIHRREIYMDSKPSVKAGQTYDEALLEKAKEVFNEHNVTIEFGSEVDIYHQFQYGIDYFLGDIVEVENRYGFGNACRVTEVVYTRDVGGPVMIPTFTAVEKEEYEIKEEQDGE